MWRIQARAVAFTLLLMICALPAVYALKPSFFSEGQQIVVVDAIGRTIVLDKIPERIVSLSPSITEILFYLGLQSYIVGVDSISYNDTYFGIDRYVREHKVVDVGGYWWSYVKIEKILALKPDLILADKGAHIPLLDTFRDYNLTVVYLNGGASRSLNDVFYDFTLISQIYGVEDKVTRFFDEVEKTIAQYQRRIEPYRNTSVLIIIDVYNGIWIAGRATYMDDLLTRLGLNNAAKVAGWKAVGLEQLYEWKPKIIVVCSEFVSEATLRDLGVYTLGVPVVFLNKTEVDILSRPGPLIQKAPAVLYKAVEKALENRTITKPQTVSTGHAEIAVSTVLMNILLYTVPAVLAGVAIGFLIARMRVRV